MSSPVDIQSLLSERGQTHGDFTDHARATQAIKAVFKFELEERAMRGQEPLNDKALESIDMIAHKLGRILAGDYLHADHWNDIAGYARLVVR